MIKRNGYQNREPTKKRTRPLCVIDDQPYYLFRSSSVREHNGCHKDGKTRNRLPLEQLSRLSDEVGYFQKPARNPSLTQVDDNSYGRTQCKLDVADQNGIMVSEPDYNAGEGAWAKHEFYMPTDSTGVSHEVKIRYIDEPVCPNTELSVNARMLFLDIGWARIRLQTDFRLSKGFDAAQHHCYSFSNKR